MARVTVEDCLEHVENRFELVMLSTKRARQLATGGKEPLVQWENDKPTVVALREIAEGLMSYEFIANAEIVEDRPGIGLDGLVGLVLERGEYRIFGDDLFGSQEFVGDDAFSDFAQGNNGRLVVFPCNAWLFTTGGQLTGALGGEHDQLKAVIHVF